MLKWKPEYALGVSEIDTQHQKLFEIANRAYSLLLDGYTEDKYDDIVAIVAELKEYTVFHFNFEEAYMLSINYKKFLSHKVEHDDFIAKIDAIDFDSLDHQQDEALKEILSFVLNWVSDHIMVTDVQYK